MSHLERLAIFAALLLIIHLLLEIIGKLEAKQDAPVRDDPLQTATFKERENRFAREISSEERLAKR